MSDAEFEEAPEQRIAVIGMAARLPAAPDLDAFWHLLTEGREGLRRYQDDEPAASGAAGLRADPGFVPVAGALDEAAAFDAEFFGFTPAEAEVTDPQHRVFLECAWEALENAGYAGAAGLDRVGVFGGASRTDYRSERIAAHPRAAQLWHPVQVAIGNDADNMPLRVSYKLGLTGPSMTVQTACSSSLMAVHLACQSLLLRESDAALAGGASVRLLESSGYVYHDGGILSPDGHCRPFDADAQGTVPGDGVGLVVLKRLDDAKRDGDHIRAVILGSAVNNDGAAKLGFTAPSAAGQAAVIAEALAAAAIEPETVDYVEAHGTATPLGDPIEVQALAEAFGKGDTTNGARRLLGSVKSNIGHLDAASGIAGFIKTVLALEHRYIPPTLHYRQPNPAADLDGSGFRVVAQGALWPQTGHPARAGVSSFGFGGTNVHVVVEAAPERGEVRERDAWQVLTLSARTPAALGTTGERLARHLSANPDTDLADAAFTLQAGRVQMPWRRAVVVPGNDARAAAELLRGTVSGGSLTAAADTDSPRPIAFLLPGQGSQYPGMGGELYRDQPVFRAAVDECAELFARHLELDLRAVLFDRGDDAEANLARTVHTQPAIFTVEIALTRLLAHWGVKPAAMLGHSLGELAAACLAGVFTLDDAALVVAARARLIQQAPPGRMLAVPLPADEVRAVLGDLVADGAPGSVAIAAINAPTACVIAGDEVATGHAHDRLREKGAACRALATSHAFHTALLEPALPEFARVVRSARLQRPRIPFVSNTTGTWITDTQATDPDYWVRQVRLPVAFSAGITTLLGAQAPDAGVPPVLLEVGPGTALRGLARLHRTAAGAVAAASSLRRSRSEDVAELRSVLEGVAASWEHGAAVDWAATRTVGTARRVPLPSYPFERRVHLLPRPDAPTPAPGLAKPVQTVTDTEAADTDPATTPDGFAALIAEIWREVLGLESIGLDEDFYLLGGNSLSAIQIMGRLREIEPDLPMSAIFTTPTVAGLAAAMSARQAAGAALEDLDPELLEALLNEIEGLEGLEPDDAAGRPSEGEG